MGSPFCQLKKILLGDTQKLSLKSITSHFYCGGGVRCFCNMLITHRASAVKIASGSTIKDLIFISVNSAVDRSVSESVAFTFPFTFPIISAFGLGK